jgi:Mor family transcriptional regulator
MIKASSSIKSPGGRYFSNFLGELHESLSIHLSLKGVEDKEAERIAIEIVDEMRHLFGGINLYFPKGMLNDKKIRNEELYQYYKEGKSIPDIAIKFGISFQRVYKSIKEEREARRNSNFQSDLK